MYKRMMSRLLLMCVLFSAFAVSPASANAQQKPKLPVPPGASNVATTPGSLTCITNISAKEVVKFYTDYFTSEGFTLTTNLTNAGSQANAVMQYVGPQGQVVDLVVSSDSGGTGIVISYTGDFDVIVATNNASASSNAAPNTATKYEPVSMPLNIELLFDSSGSM